jgi:hypothetical protein
MRASLPLGFWSLVGALVATTLLPLSAQAASGTAIVIGEETYAGVAALPNCRHAADLVSARLHELGFAVDELIDASVGETRVGINRFAGELASMPGQPSFAYVCAAATAEEQRLFLLPSDVDLRLPFDPETQGIVIPALFNAMRGSIGTFVGDFTFQSGANEASTLDALAARLPAGLHLALTMSDAPHAGLAGTVFADGTTPLLMDWDKLTSALRARVDRKAAALYAPPPGLQPASAATSVATATVEPAATPALSPALLAPQPEIAVPPAPPETAVAAAKEAPPSHESDRHPSSYTRWSSLRFKRLQSALRDHGVYSGPSDGTMSTRTIMAIRAYQVSIGQPPSGALTGPEVIQLLNSP